MACTLAYAICDTGHIEVSKSVQTTLFYFLPIFTTGDRGIVHLPHLDQ
jgi:hypothetical protein